MFGSARTVTSVKSSRFTEEHSELSFPCCRIRHCALQMNAFTYEHLKEEEHL